MKNLTILIIIITFCNCGFGPYVPDSVETKLVVLSTLSNYYNFQCVFVDTVTHIDASEYKEFGMIERNPNPVPGIKDAEVTITYNGISKTMTQITENIAIEHNVWVYYTQGNYVDYDDRIEIIPGKKYCITVKYKDMEVTSETVIPDNFQDISVELEYDSLNISWEHPLDVSYYKYDFAKWGYIDIPIYGEYPHYGFYKELGDNTVNKFLHFSVDDLIEEFENSKYVYYSTKGMKGKYRFRIGAYDKNLYEYAKFFIQNIEGGLGFFGSAYITEKEFELN